MKKLIMILALVMSLTACSGGGTTAPATVRKTCTLSESSMSASIVLDAPSEDSDLSAMAMDITIPLDTLGITAEDLESLDDEMMTYLEDYMASEIADQFAGQFGEDAYTFNVKIDENGFSMHLDFDMTKVETDEDLSMSSALEEFTSTGFKCN